MGRKIMLHLHTDINGKKPLPSDIMTGELAINYAANGETLYIKNSEEAFNEKADLIVQIMNIGGTITPNGSPLITAEEMQQGIIDVLNDDGDLSVVENIFKTYEEYQTAITEMKNKLAAMEQQRAINGVKAQSQDLQSQMEQGVQNMNNEKQFIDELGTLEL